MGIQSQNRNGSIKSCRKNATKRKKASKHKIVHTREAAVLAFSPENCELCKRKALSVEKARSYHHGHHRFCPNKKENKGLMFNSRLKKPPSKGKPVVPHRAQKKAASALVFNVYPSESSHKNIMTKVGNRTSSDLVSGLRRFLDNNMKPFDELEKIGKQHPFVYQLVMEFLLDQFQHQRSDKGLLATTNSQEAMTRYYKLFPEGSCLFTIPKDLSSVPSRYYHQVEGQQMFYLEWEFCCPSIGKLPCPNCDHELQRDRTTFSKSRTIHSIVTANGMRIYGVVMNYKCKNCGVNFKANDGRLLQQLPANVRNIYPVHPRYAENEGKATWQLHKGLSDLVESNMLTTGSGESLAHFLVVAQGKHYSERLEDYLCTNATDEYATPEEFFLGMGTISPATLRDTYNKAERSALLPYGHSHYMRYNRELQSVDLPKGSNFGVDHTFAVLKTYASNHGKAMFTMIKGDTNEVLALYVVPTAHIYQVTHGLKEACKGRIWEPSDIYSDICPHGTPTWKALFPDVDCHLGLFHFFKRVVDTFNRQCCLFTQCLADFKQCIYRYKRTDEAKLIEVLQKGTYSKDASPMSLDDITRLRYTSGWKKYEKHLRKEFHGQLDIVANLSAWVDKWKCQKDSKGQSIFTGTTVDAVERQKENVKYVLDTNDPSPYVEVIAPIGATHHLSTWKCTRPESHLEKFHEKVAHFGNGGMREELADALILRGTALHNLKCRHEIKMRKQRASDRQPKCPVWQDNVPMFQDELHLDYLNKKAEAKGMALPFPDVQTIRPDNGEVFVSDYLREQLNRNATLHPSFDENNICKCNSCKPVDTVMVAQESEEPPVPEPPVPEPPVERTVQFPQTVVAPSLIPTQMECQPIAPGFALPLRAPVSNGLWRRPNKGPPKCNCLPYLDYWRRKQLQTVMGKPPHDPRCQNFG